MEPWFIWTALSLLVLLTVALYFRQADRWIEVSASAGHHPKGTLRAYAALKAQGVRCRLRQSGAGSAWFMLGSPGVNYSLLVHEGDMKKARPLVAEALSKAEA